MTIQLSVKTFKPRTVHSVFSLGIFVTTQVMISSLLAWHVYEPLFSSSVTTFLLAFFEIHHLSPCNLIVTYRLLCINWSPELVLYSCYRSCKTCESLNGEKLERSSGNGGTYLQIRVRVISELHHNRLSINSPGHRQFCLYHFR